MKNEKETKVKLLASAKTEFLEKGYMQASLRNICRNAGVTTGALYFFFQDKEDLFAALLTEPLQKLNELIMGHFAEEAKEVHVGNKVSSMDDFAGDIEVTMQIIHCMYEYYDEFQLLLTKSQGSGFEGILDQFVAMVEKHYRAMADMISEQNHAARVSDFFVHWMSHIQIEMFVHVFLHSSSEEAAMQHAKEIVRSLISGWLATFQPMDVQ